MRGGRLGIGLGIGALGGGGGAAPNFLVQNISTDTGTTPSTTRITLGAGQNAVRVFADLVVASEPFFYLYVKRNGGSTQKVKIYAWSARILSGAQGDTFAFSTVDGRTLAMAAQAVPAVLESSFPWGPNAFTTDRGVPPYWVPSTVHITLSGTDLCFRIVDDGTNGLVFIREFDGSQWTPPRWVRRQSGRDTAVRCTYQRIAVATLDGSSISVSTPSIPNIVNSTGGMVNPYLPAVTGTTRNVNSVATLKTAIAAAVSGDEIVLASGTYTLDVGITEASFTSNTNRLSGILIRSATGVASDVTLTGNGSANNGRWLFNVGGSLFAGFRGLTFDFTGIAAEFSATSGKLAMQDVRFTGASSPAQNGLFSFASSAGQLTVEALRVTAEDSSSDCFNGSGPMVAGSRVRFIDCIGRRAEPSSASNQCLTTHLDLPVEWYGGLLSDAHTNVAAPDAITSPTYLFFAQISKGAHNSGLLNCTLFGCDIDGLLGSNIGGQGGCLFSRISMTAPGFSNNVFQNMANRAEHNVLRATVTGGRGLFNLNSTGNYDGFRYNILSQFSEAYYQNFAGGAGGSSASLGNTFVGNTTALTFDDANMLGVSKNNACKTSVVGIACTAAGMSHLTTDYNTIDPNIDADFVPGANDLVAGDAALDAFFFPTAAGNCDGNGDTTLEDFIGDSDPWGYVRVYLAGRVSRGARDRAAIHASAVLQPDLF